MMEWDSDVDVRQFWVVDENLVHTVVESQGNERGAPIKEEDDVWCEVSFVMLLSTS